MCVCVCVCVCINNANEKRVHRTYGIRHDCWHRFFIRFKLFFLISCCHFNDPTISRNYESYLHGYSNTLILHFKFWHLGIVHLRHCVRGGLHSVICNRTCLPALLYCGEWVFYKDILQAANLYFSLCIKSCHLIGAVEPVTPATTYLKHPDDHVTSLQLLIFSFRNKYIVC